MSILFASSLAGQKCNSCGLVGLISRHSSDGQCTHSHTMLLLPFRFSSAVQPSKLALLAKASCARIPYACAGVLTAARRSLRLGGRGDSSCPYHVMWLGHHVTSTATTCQNLKEFPDISLARVATVVPNICCAVVVRCCVGGPASVLGGNLATGGGWPWLELAEEPGSRHPASAPAQRR